LQRREAGDHRASSSGFQRVVLARDFARKSAYCGSEYPSI